MAKSSSKDLRVRVIGAVEGGTSRHAAAAPFGVSVANAMRSLGGGTMRVRRRR